MRRFLAILFAACLLLGLMNNPVFADDAASEELPETVLAIQRCLPPLIEMAEQIDENTYTPYSYQALSEALTAAKSLPADIHSVTSSEELNWIDSYEALYSAYYTGLKPRKASFTVSVQYGNNMGARGASASGTGYVQEVTCQRGDTLTDLISALGLDGPGYAYHAIINGKYVHFSYFNKISNFILDPSKIALHPNDEIVLFTAAPQTNLGGALGGDHAYLMQYINSVRQQRFSESIYTAEAAISFMVSVEEKDPVLYHTGESFVPAAGLTIFVSEPQAEKGGLVSTSPLIVNGETIVTDENGQAQVSLYEEGWVLVQAIDLTPDSKGNYTYYEEGAPILAGDYYSMESGAAVWIQVTPSTRLAEVKAELLDALTNEHDGYDLNILPSERLSALQSAYETAVTEIEAAEDTGTAYRAQQTGIVGMRTAFNNAVNDNEAALTRFRNCLSQLPDDVTLITQGEQIKIDSLRTAYFSMTDYQKNQLLQSEMLKYEAIMALTDLGPAREYSVTVQIAADNDEAAAIIEDMVDWLNSDGRYYAGANDLTPGEGILVNKIYTPHSDKFFNENGYITGSVSPGTEISIMTNFNYSAWLPLLYDDYGKTYVGDKGDDYTKVIGNGWTIYDTEDSTIQVVNGHVFGNIPVQINGIEYEPKNIAVSGIEGEVSYSAFVSYIEASNYKNKTGVNIYFDNPWAYFTMPYNDVTITITWGPVDSSTETSAAIDALTAAYNSYVPGNYNDTQWASLTLIYQAGVAAIKTAADPDAVKEEYIAQMAAVPAANPGTLFGSVTVTVSNNTCVDGPWYDETEPFVSETIDLYDTDTMMTVLLRALEMNEFTWEGTGGSGYGITYLSSVSLGVDELAEFTGGTGSGWMGMLNNWFVHNSFSEFSVANGTLKNGDHIEVVYTCSLGADLRSGVEGISDTIMYDISMTNGTLSPAFNGDTKDYIFTLDNGADTTVLAFEPMWRCFQSRAYKGSYQPTASSYYSSGDTVYLEDGDVLFVASGDPVWPSMSGNSGVNLKASVYTITVVGSGNAEKVQSLIDALPNVKYSNYRSCMASVEAVRIAYDALADTSSVNAAKLETAEQLIAQFTALDEFKTVLASVNATSADESTAQSVVTAYDAMTDNQKNNLTGAETAKVEALRAIITSESEILYGHLIDDEEITADDAALLYAAIRGRYTLTEEQMTRADLNVDGEITADDAAILYGFLRGMIHTLPLED